MNSKPVFICQRQKQHHASAIRLIASSISLLAFFQDHCCCFTLLVRSFILTACNSTSQRSYPIQSWPGHHIAYLTLYRRSTSTPQVRKFSFPINHPFLGPTRNQTLVKRSCHEHKHVIISLSHLLSPPCASMSIPLVIPFFLPSDF